MLKMFNEYLDAGKMSEALLIARNLFNKNPENRKVFSTYFDLLCLLAETLPSLTERQNYAEQANISLSFYSENVDLTDEVIAEIAACQERLDGLMESIIGELEALEEEDRITAVKENKELLKKIEKLKSGLERVLAEDRFNEILLEISKLDAKIDKELMDDDQKRLYENITKDMTSVINKKMSELEHKKNVDYNKRAAESYSVAFKKFREDEKKYKKDTELRALVSTNLFAYDTARLFSETLIYYNHVYSYIFNKLDDDGKYALTRFSIECERMRK